MSPEEFVVHVLKGQMNAEAIVVGTDFHFGRNRSGDVAFLKANAEKFRYDLTVVEKAMDGEGKSAAPTSGRSWPPEELRRLTSC